MKCRIWFVVLALGWVSGACASSISLPVNLGIPDGDPAGLASTITMGSQAGTFTGIEVDLDITGTYNGDLYAYLSHDGAISILLNRPGVTASDSLGYGDHGLNVTFDDHAANGDIHDYRTTLFGNSSTGLSGPLTGTWAPDGRQASPFSVTDANARTALLSSFQGLDLSGDWTLFVADLSGGDLHQLNSWGLELETASASIPDGGNTAALLALAAAGLLWAARRDRCPSSLRLNKGFRTAQRATISLLVSAAMVLTARLVAAGDGGNVTVWGDHVMYPLSGYGATFTRIASGEMHNLALTREGTVVAWGYNSLGRCDVPDGLTGVVAISAGGAHSLALRADGTVAAWGNDFDGQCDVPTGLGQVVAVAAGFSYTLALKSDGTVAAWGRNESGACDVPVGLSEVTAIAAGEGGGHNLALKKDGTIVAWGFNGFGQCDVPAGLQGVTAIAAGAEHSLALKADGTVVAWGWNLFGQCNVPGGLSEVVAIAAGDIHSLALKADGTVVAWGDDLSDQCDVPGDLRDVVAVAAGLSFSMALKQDGTVTLWGNQSAETTSPDGLTNVVAVAAGGELDLLTLALRSDGTVVAGRGFGDWEYVAPPSGLGDVVAVAAGNYHYLALKSSGTVVSWGDSVPPPAGLSGVVGLAAGRNHDLALTDRGTVVTWGGDSSGPLEVPTDLSQVVAVAAGSQHSLALKADGSVRAWGDNFFGQCNIPEGLTRAVAISAGSYHNLALKSDGTVVAWGNNHFHECDVPAGLTHVVQIAAGYSHSLALKEDGDIVGWGDWGDFARSPSPPNFLEAPVGLKGVTVIAAGMYGNVALFGAVNHPPLAGSYQLTTSRNTAGSISLFDLHRVCSDPDWDTFIIISSSGSSAEGGTARITGDTVLYTPPPDFLGNDSFTYTVRDSRGGICQGTVLVTVSQPSVLTAPTYELGTSRNQAARLPVQKLLQGVSGGVEGTLTLSDVATQSSAGGSVELHGDFILYTPLLNFVGPDIFTYSVRDSQGDTASGTVHVTVTAAAGSGPSVLGVSLQPGGAATIRCAGIPGEIYSLEMSTDLIAWQFVASATAAPNGLLAFIDTGAGNYPLRFYRARYGFSGNPKSGSVDPSFGVDGKVVMPFDQANGLALQPDGKIVVAGGSQDFTVLRLNPDGTVDESFGDQGKVTTDFYGGVDTVSAVLLQPDGRIVVSGWARRGPDGSPSDFALARYNSDGSLDPGFGVGGKATAAVPGATVYGSYGAALQKDGKIVLSESAGTGANDVYFVLARFNTDGRLDPTFGADGLVTTRFASGFPSGSYRLAIQDDGKIVAVGITRSSGSNQDFAIARYLSDGELDPTFGNGGKVTTDFGESDYAFGLVLPGDGQIVVVGSINSYFALARYNNDGSLDTSFGSGGKTITQFAGDEGAASPAVIQSDGKIIVAGYAYLNEPWPGIQTFALARYRSNGQIDASFGELGMVTTHILGGQEYDAVSGVALQPDGRIVAVGNATDHTDLTKLKSYMAVVRYCP